MQRNLKRNITLFDLLLSTGEGGGGGGVGKLKLVISPLIDPNAHYGSQDP